MVVNWIWTVSSMFYTSGAGLRNSLSWDILQAKGFQTQERLDVCVERKVILSCSRTSVKMSQAGDNSQDKTI